MIGALILGSAGAVGRLIAAHLLREGVPVTGIDRRPQTAAPHFRPILCDIARTHPALEMALREAGSIFACLPEQVALNVLRSSGAHIASGALFVDTLSVKSAIAEHIKPLQSRIEVLSINLMFAPDLGFAGHKVAVVRRQPGPKGDELLRFMRSWGAELAFMTAVDHDRLMARVQALTHAAILVFGCALKELAYDISAANTVMTPPHRTMLALLARISSGAPEVYWDMQRSNPLAGEARQALIQSSKLLASLIERGDREAFDCMLREFNLMLAPDLIPLKETAVRMFERQTTHAASSVAVP